MKAIAVLSIIIFLLTLRIYYLSDQVELHKARATMYKQSFDRLVAKDRGDNSFYPYVLKKRGE